MAETVQYNIESSLQELEQMKRVGLFSDGEIRKIIKKRQMLEYKVAKLFKRKEDFLKYIQYEIALLNLVRTRREKLRYFHKKSEIDNSIGKRINFLFKGAIRKFPEDLKLWFSHHSFLKKMHWLDSMTNMNAHMLQIHNKSPELWVTCAKWEMEDNNSIDNARKLFQRALRFHPVSELLWKEYFRLELMCVDQLLQRRKVLGIEQSENETEDNVLTGQVALVVYNNAVKAIDGVQVILTFLEICKDFDFTASIVNAIYSDLESRYPSKEETLNALALRCMDPTHNESTFSKKFLRSCLKNSIIKFEEAVKLVPTEKMWDFFIQFLLERVRETKSEKKMQQILENVLDLMQEASILKLLSLEKYTEWIKLLYTRQEFKEARDVSLKAAALNPSDPLVWQYCLSLHADDSKGNQFMEIFYRAITNVQGKKALPLWEKALEWVTCGKIEHMEEIFEKGLLQSPDIQVFMKQQYLAVTAFILGIDESRNLYNRLRKEPPLSVEFFETMLSAEKAQFCPRIKMIKRIYEDALNEFGATSPNIWLDYMKFVETHSEGKPGEVGRLYWRATKNLEPEFCDEFIKEHTLRFNVDHLRMAKGFCDDQESNMIVS